MKINLLHNFLVLTLLFAGFSQIIIGGIRPGNVILLLLFGTLTAKRYLKLNPVYIFVLISISYAFIIGKLSKPSLYLTEIITFLILFSLIKYFQKINESNITRYLNFFNYSLFFSNIIAFIFLFLLPQFREAVIDVSSYGFRFKGFFGQANGYAFIQLIALPISTFIFIKKRSLLNFVIIITSFTALIFTQSRGAILGMFLSLFIVSILFILNNNPLKQIKILILPTALIILIVFGIFTFFPKYIEEHYGLNLSRINPLKESTSERSITAFSYEDIENDRFYLIENGIKTLAEYPWGLGYQEQHLIIGQITGRSLIPHNFYLDLLLDFGLFIGIIWNLIIVYIIYEGFKFFIGNKISFNDLFFYLHMIMLSVLLYYLTHSPKWTYFYIILAIYISYIFPRSNKNQITT